MISSSQKAAGALIALLLLGSPIAANGGRASYEGFAARYRPGLMGKVARNRGMEPASCMMAATHEPLGTWVRVRGIRTEEALLCKVVDVPHPRHRAAIIRRGIIGELDHTSAGIICGSTREPPRDCPIIMSRQG